ncbi:hypothetical protein J2Y45_002327 [Dyadobacter sp. BE34]|uniref:Lipolytic protein G-D-S-L family n=1 Tax=Dyadobacter fermentans TaxID=94254 RepID=A0ABU1QW30_9BACT|nr:MULTISPECIES: hypothetical protein [Dyadobacter]MDR6805364.1 hypothetical protein [Dyadobacter fermentans]MDR7042876.1 hypothetical protein [Dyadobacter sp. BE242]MDR7197188.1 hypothetical protein [Dyadobacter sp. BE34]MDR7215377.1 hypothetical protein [Dyadobacter sp. BE31]MDR7262913.1 hypothetical protein [Dyadobacter sp. BE32]
MKTHITVLSATLLAFTFLACSNVTRQEIPPQEQENMAIPLDSLNPLIIAEITRPVKPDPSFSWAPKTGSVDLGSLKNTSGKEPVLMVIGEARAAGYRDGGLYRQGQLTSYPNLVARQMGLANFDPGLFDKEQGNGSGYFVQDPGSTLPNWSKVTNNLAFDNDKTKQMKPYTGGMVHNISVPGNGISKYDLNLSRIYSEVIDFERTSPLPSSALTANYLWTTGLVPLALINRIIPADKANPWAHLKEMNPDIGIIDLNTDVYTIADIAGGENGLLGPREVVQERLAINYFREKKAPYIYMTVPDVLDFPYFKWFTLKKLASRTKNPIYSVWGSKSVLADNKTIFLPTINVINVLQGNAFETLEEHDVILPSEISKPEWHNDFEVAAYVREFGHPLVDFYSVYKKIIHGDYVSEDGFRIDPSYPNGNFFSSDGIHPTAIGQAVLANEVIKVLNKSYKAKIPLINVGMFAAEIEKVK